MGSRRLIGLAALGALFIPPLVAAVARRRLLDAGDELSSELDRYAIFDGVQLASRAAAFRGGETIAWYGSLDLDLREARLDPGGAHIRAMSIFGGTRIVVPEDWPVEVYVSWMPARLARYSTEPTKSVCSISCTKVNTSPDLSQPKHL